MKKIFLFLLIIMSGFVFSQKKSDFDKAFSSPGKNALGKSAGDNSMTLTKELSEITLIDGCYYTVGTTAGVSATELDDNCQITYGHPFAMTSYPLFSVDGEWYKPDEYFYDTAPQVSVQGDSIIMIYEVSNLLRFEFTAVESENGYAVKLISTITNLDTTGHNFGLGLTFDPALGKYGDGYLTADDQPVETESVLTGAEISQSLQLWEKNTGAKGIGCELSFSSTTPSKIIAANWNNTYKVNSPEYEVSSAQKLYDLYLKAYWGEQAVDSAGSVSAEMNVEMLEPDFSSDVFTRWDIPAYFDMEDGIMFPRSLKTFLQVYNNGQTDLITASAELSLPYQITSVIDSQSIIVHSGSSELIPFDLNSKIIYQDIVVAVSALVTAGNDVLDQITKNVFIPFTPVSDTGLTVNIDSVDASAPPKVKLFFETIRESNEFKIGNLAEENVFLYENSIPVENFKLQKDTTGGAGAVDFVFILDVTGSMGDEINDVKNNIIEFADSLSYRGVDYQLGMVTFLDVIENIYPFTDDVQLFQQRISEQYAHGGGDGPENSLEALFEGAKFPFRPGANKIFIWITDADYHELDEVTSLSRNEVINDLLSKEIRVHAIGSEYYKSSFYDPITNATGGDYYDIYGNFRDIFLDISKLKSVTRYMLSFETTSDNPLITLEIRYAGLGGEATVDLGDQNPSPAFTKGKLLSFFPNPFNPEIKFNVRQGNFETGEIQIYNVLGQKVKTISLDRSNMQHAKWNVNNEPVASGFYIVRLLLTDGSNVKHSESAKILYLK